MAGKTFTWSEWKKQQDKLTDKNKQKNNSKKTYESLDATNLRKEAAEKAMSTITGRTANVIENLFYKDVDQDRISGTKTQGALNPLKATDITKMKQQNRNDYIRDTLGIGKNIKTNKSGTNAAANDIATGKTAAAGTGTNKKSGNYANDLLKISTNTTGTKKTTASDMLQIMAQNTLNKDSAAKTQPRYGLGNIDLNNRQVVKNNDGTISTEQSFSFYDDSINKEVLIPAVVNGKVLSQDDAIQHYLKTNEYLGKFDTPEEANKYAEELHQEQEKYYSGKTTTLGRSFLEQSKLDQAVDPNSKLNKWLQEKEAKAQESAELWGKANELTPYEKYKGVSWENRKAAADKQRTLENVQAYNNAHPNNNWGLLGERREEAEKQIAQSNAFLEQAEKDKEAIFNIYNGTSTIKAYRGRELPPYMVKPSDYEENRSKYDQPLYDFYYGDGEYNRITNYGQNQQKELMEQRLDALWKDLGNVAEEVKKAGYNYTDFNADIQLAKSNIGYNEDQLKQITYEENAEEEYNSLIDKYIGHQTHSKFNPEYDKGKDPNSIMTELERGVFTNDVHRIYSLLGGGREYDSWIEYGTKTATPEYSYAMMMTDGSNGSFDEVGLFMDLYNEAVSEGREPTEAKAFLDGLQTALQWRYNNTVENINYAEMARLDPVGSTISSIAAQQIDAYLAIPRTIAGWVGDKSVENPYGKWYATTRMKQGVQNEVANNIGGLGGKTYLNFMQTANNIINALTVGGKTKLAQEVMGLGKFFLQVYEESTYEYLKETDYNTASWLGAMDALFETAEELLPYDTMLNSGNKSMVVALLSSGASELLEEGTGATAGEKLKGVITGRDSEEKRRDEILHDGGYYDGNGKWVELSKDKTQRIAQASLQAYKEFWNDAKEQMIGGFFGGSFG